MRLLGTARLTWRRLDVVIQQAAGDPASALWRDMSDHPYLELQAAVRSEHTLRVLAWQKTPDGKANRNLPKPLTAEQDTQPRRADRGIAAKLAAFQARTNETKEA